LQCLALCLHKGAHVCKKVRVQQILCGLFSEGRMAGIAYSVDIRRSAITSSPNDRTIQR